MKLFKNRSHSFASDAAGEVIMLNAPVSGRILSLDEVHDPTFSEHILGDGFAIVPEEGRIMAPADAVITSVPHTNHAISMTTDSGVELLIHVGIDTVELEGKYFNIPVALGDHVKAGEVLIEVDLNEVKNAGYDVVTPVIVTNMEQYTSLSVTGDMTAVNTPFLLLEKRNE